MKSDSIVLLLLAAGESRRFGSEKLLANFAGKPILQWSLDSFGTIDAMGKILVVNPDFEPEMFEIGSFQTVINENYKDGISTSIVRGLRECPDSCEGIVLALADMPLITKEDVERLVGSVTTEDEMVSYVFEGKKGFPTYISRKVFSRLSRITGDRGAYQLVKSGLAKMREIEGRSHNVFDIDIPESMNCTDHGLGITDSNGGFRR